MLKTDLKKTHKQLYTAKATPGQVNAPKLSYLMIDGMGDPNAAGYAHAVEALYSVAYTIRFALKNAEVVEFPVMPLQGLWWTETEEFTWDMDRADWHWTMMIVQPDQVTKQVFDDALAAAAKKKPEAQVDRVRFADIDEGRCVQVLHTGPYSTERETVEKLHDYIRAEGLTFAGRHHEIYLSNPKRTVPEKMKTIIRYPVARP